MWQIESTYKSRDVEETIDLYFYRPVGYVIANICRALRVTPNAVTIVSILIGVTGGHLLFYRSVMLNVWGFVLWVIADTLDSVDGQLARMTNHKSKFGRILDGLGGNIIFLSIYLHLLARMVDSYDVPWLLLFLVVLAGGISHSIQSALADYYRNAYLKYVVDSTKSELDDSVSIRREFEATSFAKHPIRKILLRIYLNYTVEQEAFSKNFQRLRRLIRDRFADAVPSWFSSEYRTLNKPLLKYYSVLTTNIRMILMATCVIADLVPLYFALEIVAINFVMVFVTMRQESISAFLLRRIENHRAGA